MILAEDKDPTWCEKWSWRLWITLGVFLQMIWGTLIQFPQIYLMLKYLTAAMTWPTDSFYTRLRSDWMWNVVLKTLY